MYIYDYSRRGRTIRTAILTPDHSLFSLYSTINFIFFSTESNESIQGRVIYQRQIGKVLN